MQAGGVGRPGGHGDAGVAQPRRNEPRLGCLHPKAISSEGHARCFTHDAATRVSFDIIP